MSRFLSREHPTVSALLRRMKKKGLISMKKDSRKKNMWRVSLTEKGKEAYKQSAKRESIHMAFSSLSEDDRQRLASYLENLRDQSRRYLIRDPDFPPT